MASSVCDLQTRRKRGMVTTHLGRARHHRSSLSARASPGVSVMRRSSITKGQGKRVYLGRHTDDQERHHPCTEYPHRQPTH